MKMCLEEYASSDVPLVFWSLGGFFAISPQHTLFIPCYSEQNVSSQVPPASESTTLPHLPHPVPLTKTKEARFYILQSKRSPCPGQPALSFELLVFWFFLLVSSNTYIVRGETASIHSPRSHSPPGSWRGSGLALPSSLLDEFCAKLGLGALSPHRFKQLMRGGKKERKCLRALSLFAVCSFFCL